MGVAHAQSDSGGTLDQILIRKQLLSAALDSLELVKQSRKREGESLEELERQTGAIKQSIESLRVQLARAAESGHFPASAPDADKRSLLDMFTTMPKSGLDWAILSISGIAVICAIILFIGFIQLARSKRSRTAKAPQSSKTAPQPNCLSGTLTRNASEIPTKTDTHDSDGLEELRRLAASGYGQETRAPAASLPALHEQAKNSEIERPSPSGDLREQVLEAARAGMAPKDIAKQLHVSCDQVQLIVRMAENNR